MKEEKEVSGSDIINFLQNLEKRQNEALEDVIDFLFSDSIFDHLQESLKVLTVLSAEDRKNLLETLEEKYAKKV